MNRYEITYLGTDGEEAVNVVRAESAEEAEAYFASRTPFVPMSVKDLGKDVDKGKPPVIGPP